MITFPAYQIVLKNKNRIPLFSLNLLNSFQLVINTVFNNKNKVFTAFWLYCQYIFNVSSI